MSSKPLIIAYRTELRLGLEKYYPPVEILKSWKADEVPAKVAEKNAKFEADARSLPYFGFLAEIAILDWSTSPPTVVHFRKSEVAPLPALQLHMWLRQKGNQKYLDAFQASAHHSSKADPPEYYFLGFDVRTFLKMFGTECAEYKVTPRLPLGIWYNNSDHRDIESAATGGATGISLQLVLDRLSIRHAEGYLPGVNVSEDARIITELASSLGFFGGRDVEMESLPKPEPEPVEA